MGLPHPSYGVFCRTFEDLQDGGCMVIKILGVFGEQSAPPTGGN